MSEADLLEAARLDLGEDRKTLPRDLETIRNWISKCPHLHTIKQDDAFLLMFLRACKFSLEKTKDKLDMFFTVRGGLPIWYGDWDPRRYIEERAKQTVTKPHHNLFNI